MSSKVILLPDMHVPEHDKRSLSAVLRRVEVVNPDVVVLLGDLMSLDCISKLSSLKTKEAMRLRKDYVKGRQVLDEIANAAPNAKLVYIEGNHEFRANRLVEDNPNLEGLVEPFYQLDLPRRGIQWVPFWSTGKIFKWGKASFGHGLYINEHHAKQHLNAFDENFFYGHTHDHQVFSKVTNGDNDTKMAMSCGCLCLYRQYYMRGRPNRWQQMYVELYFDKQGFFNTFPVAIFNHKFTAPDGEVYAG